MTASGDRRGRRAAVYLGFVRDTDRSPDLGDHVVSLLLALVGVACIGLSTIWIDPRQHPAYWVLVVLVVGTLVILAAAVIRHRRHP